MYVYTYIGTDGEGAPLDRAQPIIQKMPEVFSKFLLALAIILLICFVFMASVLFFYRHSRLLKGAYVYSYIYVYTYTQKCE
jgi:hypothetical protein